MSTLEPTTDKLIVQRGADLYTTTIENMSTIQDDDLVLIGRGSESYKMNGAEFKAQSGGGGTAEAPEIFSVSLAGSGPGFSGETYTTTVNMNPGNPIASLDLKAKVEGAFGVAGVTSAVTNVEGGGSSSPANGDPSAPTNVNSQGSYTFGPYLDSIGVTGFTGLRLTGPSISGQTVNISAITVNGLWMDGMTRTVRNVVGTPYTGSASYSWETLLAGTSNNGGAAVQGHTEDGQHVYSGEWDVIEFTGAASGWFSLTYYIYSNPSQYQFQLRDQNGNWVNMVGDLPATKADTLLTFQTDENLNNGAFEPGDAVTKSGQSVTISNITNTVEGAGSAINFHSPATTDYAAGPGNSQTSAVDAGLFDLDMWYSNSSDREYMDWCGAMLYVGSPTVYADQLSIEYSGATPGVPFQIILQVSYPINDYIFELTDEATWQAGATSKTFAAGTLNGTDTAVGTPVDIYPTANSGNATIKISSTLDTGAYATITGVLTAQPASVVSVDGDNKQMSLDGGQWENGDVVVNTVTHAVLNTAVTSAITSQEFGTGGDPNAPNPGDTNFTANYDFSSWLQSQGVTAITGLRLEGPYDDPNYTYTAILYNVLIDGAGLWTFDRTPANVVGTRYYAQTFSFEYLFNNVNATADTQTCGTTTADNGVYSCTFDPIPFNSTFVASYYSYGDAPAAQVPGFKAFIADQNGNWVSLFGSIPWTELEFTDNTNLINFSSEDAVKQTTTVIPITSAITNVDPGVDYAAQTNLSANTGEQTPDKAFNGLLTEPAWYCASGGWFQWDTNITCTKFEIYSALPTGFINGTINSVTFDSASWTDMGWTDITSDLTNNGNGTYTITQWKCQRNGSAGIYAFRINGNQILIDNIPVLTFQDSTNLNNLWEGAIVTTNAEGTGASLVGNEWPSTVVADGIYLAMTWADFTYDQTVEYVTTGYAPFYPAGNTFDFPYTAAEDTDVYFLFGQNSNNSPTVTVTGNVIGGGTPQEVTGGTSGNPSQINFTLKAGTGIFKLYVSGPLYCYGRSAFGNATIGTGIVSNIDPDGPTMLIDGGEYTIGQQLTGPQISAVGVCNSVDSTGNTMTVTQDAEANATIVGTPYQPESTWSNIFYGTSYLEQRLPYNYGALGSQTATYDGWDVNWNTYKITFDTPFVGNIRVYAGDVGQWGYNDMPWNGPSGPGVTASVAGWNTLPAGTELSTLNVGYTYQYLYQLEVNGRIVSIETGPRFAIGSTVSTVNMVPIQSSTAYLNFDSGTGTVTGLSTTDPGYKPSPPNNALVFTDPMTGNTWNEELPAGTTIETRAYAENTEGSSESDWTAPLTPTPLTVDMTEAELSAAYLETALLFATFENRHQVYCGNMAIAQRQALIDQLVVAGYDLNDILNYV